LALLSIDGGPPPGGLCATTGDTPKIMRGSAINKVRTLTTNLPVFCG
jgi:hypothetical protein